MIVASWRIASTHGGHRRWFWVRVHSSVQHMRSACYRARPWEGRDFWSDAAAVCHTTNVKYDIDADAEMKQPIWPANGYAGTIRLVQSNMTPEIIAHEIAHATAAVYRMNYTEEVNLGDGYEETVREENFAYICGQLSSSMDAWLTEYTERERSP